MELFPSPILLLYSANSWVNFPAYTLANTGTTNLVTQGVFVQTVPNALIETQEIKRGTLKRDLAWCRILMAQRGLEKLVNAPGLSLPREF